jgi:uncharacterized protein
VLGLALAFVPQLLLALPTLITGADRTPIEVTAATAAILVVSTLVLYGWQAIAAWLFSLRISRRGVADWGFVAPNSAFFWTIPVALVASYIVVAVHGVLLDPPPQDIVEQFPRTPGGVVLFFVLAVVFAPFFEELFFRGFLYTGFRASWGWWPAALASAAVFSLAHLQLTLFIPLFALGVALAWVYERTGSVWTAVALHAVFNGLSVLFWALGAAG